MKPYHISIDGQAVPYQPGQTLMEAATAAGVYIPHLCHNPEFKPHGSCKLCTVKVNGRSASACTLPAGEGQEVQNNTPELNATRRAITRMLFVEGNHICPGCEKTGNCQLQAVGYFVGMLDTHYPHFFPTRRVDASHPDVMLDLDRCILCELCVRASRDVDGKNVFGLAGRGLQTRLVVNSASGLLKDTAFSVGDKAAQVCPVGAILVKRKGYEVPIGERVFDHHNIGEVSLEHDQAVLGADHG
ncbi:[NiFe] hydrogenase diaphorase moiety small subunit [Methylomagnum ishizawai]|uniref:[NiFe] hydrogenase diaphorase moiety small subunit n=1 Tax=Methylomagnum ishizawai TaxID=1760988 RepID=A0A1Y6CTL2_9GAMM|nr:2Fe-2S iron-sulfur cluster-binding protein [Methylomagnum ishizawai]SMF93540.1 [NiFe] hydrogenase diaphorase moiety small subunit [Methylomagnum ishizawai]